MVASKRKAIVKIDRSWEPGTSNFWLLSAVSALVLVTAGAAFLLYWYNTNEPGMSRFEPEVRELRQQVEFYKAENEELTTDLARAERSGAIDKEASKQLQTTIIERENKIRTLKEEVSFYKSIVNPKGGKKGLGIKEFSLADTSVENSYRFVLVATQSAGKKAVKGRIIIRLQGHKDGDSVTLGWKDFSVEGKKSPYFKFQYFQKFEGSIVLPEDFEPENVLVRLVPEGKKVDVLQQSYSWQSIFKSGEEL